MKAKVRRESKPFRLLVSGLVVATSILGAWLAIENSKATESYLITKESLATGSPITASDVTQVELALFEMADKYLKAGQLPPGSYLNRSLAVGEAIPKSAVTTQELDDWSRLVLTPSIELSAQIQPGSIVSVWAAPALDYQRYGEPVIAALDAEVVAVRPPQTNFAQALASVEIRVPVEMVQSLLRAISNGDSIAITATGKTLAD